MKVAIDISPLKSGHKVRGTGFYLSNLKDSLIKYYPDSNFVFFKKRGEIPSDADIIHYPYFDPFFLTLPFANKRKSVVTVHDLIPLVFKENFPSGIKGRIKWEIQKRSLKNSKAIITDSDSSKKDISRLINFDNDKIHVVYLAAASHFKIHSDTEKEEVIKKFNLPEKFILYVGDVTWNKNLPRLIEAINKTPHHLIIVGKAFANKDFDKNNSWNKSIYSAQTLASGNEKIIPLGFVSDHDLAAIYASATALVMPSLYEGFGLPVLEAMQSGCPVITSGEGSLREVAGSSAYYIDPYDVNSIVQGINEITSDGPLRNTLSKKGLIQAKKFSWKKTAEDTFKVYEKVINNG